MKKLAILSSNYAKAEEFSDLVGQIWKVSNSGIGNSIIINIDVPLNDMVWNYYQNGGDDKLVATKTLQFREFLGQGEGEPYLTYGRYAYIKNQVAQPSKTLMILCEVRDAKLIEYLKEQQFSFICLETTPQEEQQNFAREFPLLEADWKTFVQPCPNLEGVEKVKFNGSGALKVVSSLID
jgi:hypothetical protein